MSVHICICKNEETKSELLAKSFNKYGGIDKIIVLSDKNYNLEALRTKISSLIDIEKNIVQYWSSDSFPNILADKIKEYAILGYEVLVNLTGTTPDIGFMVNMAVCRYPAHVYCYNMDGELIDFEKDDTPDYRMLNSNQLRVLHNIGNGKLKQNIEITDDRGRIMGIKGVSNALKALKSLKLIYCENGVMNIEGHKSPAGHKPQMIKRTELGEKFYNNNRSLIDKIIIK